MTPDEEAKTLFTVESTGLFIHSPHNEQFRFTEALSFRTDNDFTSRSPTPASSEPSTPAPNPITKTYLRFTVDNVGEKTSFIFGSDRESCDILLLAETPIPNRLFAVHLENNGRTAMLQSLNPKGLAIQSNIYEKQLFRKKRALHLGDTVTIFLTGVDIHVQFYNHKTHPALHEHYLQQLAPRLAQAVPGVNLLTLDSIPTSRTQLQVNPYHLYDELGSGTFGTVYKAINSFTGNVVAVKVFRKGNPMPLKEAAILQSISHPNIVRFISFISSAVGPCMLVMELLDHPNLDTAHQEWPLRLEQTRVLLFELLHALAYLHEKHITHRDLKPSNIIIISREPIRIKITDFGLAIERSDQLTSHCGSLPYLAPEVHSRSYSNKVDIWSVGVIALYLGSGLPDYPDGTPAHDHWPRMLKERAESASLDPVLSSFVKSLLHLLPDCRPSALESLDDRFLRNESQFLDDLGSPTEYAPTPPEYLVQSAVSSESSLYQSRHRSANAPSPSDCNDNDAGQTQIYTPLPNPPGQAQVPAAIVPSVHLVKSRDKNIVTTYWKLKYAGTTVMYSLDKRSVNATQLFKGIGYKQKVNWDSVARNLGTLRKTVIYGSGIGGTYLSVEDVERVLRYLELPTVSIQELNKQISE